MALISEASKCHEIKRSCVVVCALFSYDLAMTLVKKETTKGHNSSTFCVCVCLEEYLSSEVRFTV